MLFDSMPESSDRCWKSSGCASPCPVLIRSASTDSYLFGMHPQSDRSLAHKLKKPNLPPGISRRFPKKKATKPTQDDDDAVYDNPVPSNILIPTNSHQRKRNKPTRKRKHQLLVEALRRFKKAKKTTSQTFSQQQIIPSSETSNKEMLLLPAFEIGVARTQGARSYMEDRHQVVSNLVPNSSVNSLFCGVFDGHNGADAAEHAMERLHEILAEDEFVQDLASEELSTVLTLDKSKQKLIHVSIHDAFLALEKEILEMTIQNGQRDGCTALMAMIVANQMFVANVGDTRAVIARKGEGCFKRLSVDHKPDQVDEKRRITNSGGKVVFSGCWRVAHEKVPIRLAVSRSFGDHPLKCNLPGTCKSALVSARPFIDTVVLTPKDQFIILASDGLWDVITDEDAVKLVRSTIVRFEQNIGNHTIIEHWNPSDRAMKIAANKLVEYALKNRSCDNITAMVIGVKWIS